MGELKKLYEQSKNKSNSFKIMEDTVTIVDEHLEEFKHSHPNEYHELMNELFIAVNGYHFNEDMLKDAVTHMINDDGSKSPRFSVQECVQSARQLGYANTKKFNEWDLAYTINMMYSDYCEVLGDSITPHSKMANKFLNDKDAPDGKALRYYLCMREK